MASADHAGLPTYLSSRSADVILSDIRPTTLTDEALISINVFLDELLCGILTAAGSLSTTHLRAGLNKILPTTLGKEAILEAELELRAYWERTGGATGLGPSQVLPGDGNIDLPWTYELLRLKCEAYSTLSDTDENSEAESRLVERMNASGLSMPKQTLLAPASLYLTAIIESICEHLLSNVGRVTARDSSRTAANSQDLFIALCEDDMIYGLFKSMKVYERIELLSKPPSRSINKSFSREKLSGSASPPADSLRKDVVRNGARHRISSDSSSTGPNLATHLHSQSSRSSSEKSRGIKIFNNRGSQDLLNGREPQNGHNKTESFTSVNTKQSVYSGDDKSPISSTFSGDTRSQDFDDMMRSGSTMRVSLTPDRLRTMEVSNKGKSTPTGRQKTPTKKVKGDLAEKISSPHPEQPKRATRLPLHPVDSITEDDEDAIASPPPTSRPRQLSAVTAAGYGPSSFVRVRSASTSDPPTTKSTKSSLAISTLPPDSESVSSLVPPSHTMDSALRRRASPQELHQNVSQPFVQRQLSRNLDVDDETGGDSDEELGIVRKTRKTSHPSDKHKGFSPSTKDLINFLAEGPPEHPGVPTLHDDSLAPKKSGRLHKMLSRITLSGTTESGRSSRKGTGVQDMLSPPFASATNLGPLANRPVPPRYPTVNSSLPQSEHAVVDQDNSITRQRSQSVPVTSSLFESGAREVNEAPPVPVVPIIVPPTDICDSPSIMSKKLSDSAIGTPDVTHPRRTLSSSLSVGSGQANLSAPSSPVTASAPSISPSVPPSAPSSPPLMDPVPALLVPGQVSSSGAITRSARPRSPPANLPVSVVEHARSMRRALVHASNVDECRLLIDIFLTRSKLVEDSTELKALIASAPMDPTTQQLNALIEKTIVGLFLDGGESDCQQMKAYRPCSCRGTQLES